MEYSLKELNAKFLRVIDNKTYHKVDTLSQAHGIVFLCPKCFEQKGGPIGTHSIICWSHDAGAPDDIDPLPGRWKMNGSSLDDLTLDGEQGKSRSVLLLGGCGWHGFVTNGRAG